MTIGQDIDGMIAKLKQQRDELKLQAHLFKAETREEWDKAEVQWKQVQERSRRIGDTTGQVGEEIAGTLKNVGREIQEGYNRIRRKM
jgi:hypothetical protein